MAYFRAVFCHHCCSTSTLTINHSTMKHVTLSTKSIYLSEYSKYNRNKSTGFVVCLPETYGRNGMTPIFRSFQNCQFPHMRQESWEHFNVLLYIILSTTVSFLEDTILLGLLFIHFVYISKKNLTSTLYMCVMYLTSFDGLF